MSEQRDEITRVAVVGTGSIGAAWAIVFARAGLEVSLYDTDKSRISAARKEIAARLGDFHEFGLVSEEPTAIIGRITTAETLRSAIAETQWVQECAPEKLDLKRSLFAELLELTGDSIVLASSSSTIRVSEFVPDPERRARCLVVHPGNPPTLLSVVEVVPAPETDRGVVARATVFLNRVGMTPIVLSREVEGFVFNRLQGTVLREAYCLVRDGVVAPDDIDKVMREGLGLRWAFMGPFETADLNTAGGLGAHAARLGPAYARMGAERGQNDPWTPDLVATVVAARRAKMPLDRWDARRSWRDTMLMAIVKAKRDALARFGA